MAKKLYKIFIFYVIVGCQADKLHHMGSGYYYDGEGNGSNRIFLSLQNKTSQGVSIDRIIIYPSVDFYNYDDNYILARQFPDLEGVSRNIIGDISKIISAFRCNDNLHKGKTSDECRRLIEKYKDCTNFYQNLAKIPPNQYSAESTNIKILLAKEIIAKDPYHEKVFSQKENYWIIDKKGGDIYGPFNKHEYMNKRKSLGVPEDLRLE